MPAFALGISGDRAAQDIEQAQTSSSVLSSLDTASQTLVELRVMSKLLSIGLNVQDDLDQLRADELAALFL